MFTVHESLLTSIYATAGMADELGTGQMWRSNVPRTLIASFTFFDPVNPREKLTLYGQRDGCR